MSEEFQNSQPMSPEVQTPPPGPPGSGGSSGLAIASLVLGILGLLTCITAPVGLVLGIIAMVRANREPEKYSGTGLAIAGVVLSCISVLFVPIIAAILFPVFARAHIAGQASQCMNNVKQVSTAMVMYMSDWDDRLPAAENWNEALSEYVKNPQVMFCPAADEKSVPSYALNARLDSLPESAVYSPPDTVMIYESIPGRNRFGGPELLPSPPRHSESNIVGYVDGHVKRVTSGEAAGLVWDAGEVPSPLVAPPMLPEPPPSDSGG